MWLSSASSGIGRQFGSLTFSEPHEALSFGGPVDLDPTPDAAAPLLFAPRVGSVSSDLAPLRDEWLIAEIDVFATGRFLSPTMHAAGCPCGEHGDDDKFSASSGATGSVAAIGPEVGNTAGTARALAVGASYTSTIEIPTDRDWYRVTLVAGESYVFSVNGTGATALADSILTLRSSTGAEVAFNDDANGLNSAIRFTAQFSGTYYLDVGGYYGQGQTNSGDYVVSAAIAEPLREFTYDEIADQLTDGFWGGNGTRWNAGAGSTITVNITALDAAYSFYATEALALWSDLTGITFRQVATGGQIIFNDNEEGAFASTSSVGGFTTSGRINVSTDWSGGAVGNYNSYTFQTFIHEIGHVLGLGHGGNYNGDASYASDALYLNDAWSTTVMSYFSQRDNGFFSGQGFTYGLVLSPMVADVLAIQNLYGLSTTTRAGATTYGFNNNSGREIYNAATNPGAVYTIFDAGGIDTLDYSRHSQAQVINLNAESFSNIGGSVGNVAIARGTVIENAIGGLGNDTLIGNAVANRLDGGAGTNRLEGGAGNDVYVVRTAGETIIEAAGAAGGTDTVEASINWTLATNVERLVLTGTATTGTGNAGANQLVGNAAANTLIGLAGNDRLDGGTGADRMEGGAGSDIYVVDNAGDVIIEAAGAGTADQVQSSISLTLAANVERLTLTGTAALSGTGNALANRLYGNDGANKLSGLDGADWLDGGAGRDLMTGGTGNDRFVFDDGDFGGRTLTAADRITDFATGDKLDLKLVDAVTGGADNAFAFIGSAAFTGVAGQLRYQQYGATTVVMGDQNGDGVADFWIAVSGTRAFVASDFLL